MQVTISGRRLTITEPIRAYVEEKISKISKINDSDSLTIEVVLSHDRNPAIPNHNHVEITGFFRDYKLRVEEAAPDMYEAIDLAVDRFERQLRKYKTRLLSRRRSTAEVFKTAPGAQEMVTELDPVVTGEEALGDVVRSKNISSERMTEDEAILQMEMLGHDFFMFILDESGENAVVYKRYAGDYGMIKMDAEQV